MPDPDNIKILLDHKETQKTVIGIEESFFASPINKEKYTNESRMVNHQTIIKHKSYLETAYKTIKEIPELPEELNISQDINGNDWRISLAQDIYDDTVVSQEELENMDKKKVLLETQDRTNQTGLVDETACKDDSSFTTALEKYPLKKVSIQSNLIRAATGNSPKKGQR